MATACKRRQSSFEFDLPITVASGTGAEVTLLRLSTLQRNGAIREFWISTRASVAEPIMLQRETTGELVPWEVNGVVRTRTVLKPSVTSRVKYRVDCKKNKLVATSSVLYERDGSVKSSYSLRESQIDQEFSDVVPDTVGQDVAKFACRL